MFLIKPCLHFCVPSIRKKKLIFEFPSERVEDKDNVNRWMTGEDGDKQVQEKY